MGIFLNPGNSGFTVMRNSDYVDKTGLIAQINKTINTSNMLTCISRPRRFGKSYAAKMLAAYYDKSCDSSDLFAGLEIANDPSFPVHLNHYHVLYIDMTTIMGEARGKDLITYLQDSVSRDIHREMPALPDPHSFLDLLVQVVEYSGTKIIAIIDEWDAPIREMPQIEGDYLSFLRALFKSSQVTAKIFSAAYMTGILPIKKNGSQSAISDFKEFTMLKPRKFAPYVGFTEQEVLQLCQRNDLVFSEMKRWYDGYHLQGVGSVYNPNSVMQAIANRDFDSYWTETSAADNLLHYLSMDYGDLSRVIADLTGGNTVQIDPRGFSNDLTHFRNRDDVLTLLVHLGYLAYDDNYQKVCIPNEEILLEFSKAVREVHHLDTINRVRESDKLLEDTIHQDEGAVARQIEKIHREETSPLHYNREESLRSVIKLAYFSYKDHYLQWEELPAGNGYADIVYLPKKDSPFPALVIELKWDKTAEGAIAQILDRKYPDVLRNYGGEILLVGISYDKDASDGEKTHHCRIQKWHA